MHCSFPGAVTGGSCVHHGLGGVAFGPSDDRAVQDTVTPRILIVEDDFFVAAEMEHCLRDAGYDVVGVAMTAEEAVSLAVEGKPQLAIMDIRLAGQKDGIEAATDLWRDFGIPSIFATAHGDPLTRNRAQAACPVGWLEKPYGPESLISLVKTILPQR